MSILRLLVALTLGSVMTLVMQSFWQDGSPFLAKRIFSNKPHDVIINFTELRGTLRSLIEGRKEFRTGLYFEYLPSGSSIGINEGERFISASLLKTPFIMGLIKRIKAGFLNDEAMITLKEADLDRSFGTLWKEGAGHRLSVREAIELALRHSDNTAVRALSGLIPDDLVLEVFAALDIPMTQENALVTVTAKNYASVFRCLYLSCMLDYDDSEYVLRTLSDTIFAEGIRAGIPAAIPYSHKVGIFEPAGTERWLRLDCGIVYVPDRPYLLCIFIEGASHRSPEMQSFAASISKMIYDFVRDSQ